MESRMDKYYNEQTQELSRTKRNAKLYKDVNGSYTELDYLPVSDNSSEIDVDKLREIVSSREDYHKKNDDIEEDIFMVEKKDYKSYDINELLEKAKSSKTKVVEKKEDNYNYNFLKTLESNELLKKDIEEAIQKEEEEKIEEKEDVKKIGNTLSLDILSDLKGDTVLMETVSNSDIESENDVNGDIPINNELVNENDKTFYSGSYKFSSKDFFDDDLSKIEGKHSFIKIFFVILIIAVCVTGVYFLINYLGTK